MFMWRNKQMKKNNQFMVYNQNTWCLTDMVIMPKQTSYPKQKFQLKARILMRFTIPNPKALTVLFIVHSNRQKDTSIHAW